MVKVMMYGCNGYMGHVICNLIKDMENVTVAAGIDPSAAVRFRPVPPAFREIRKTVVGLSSQKMS